MTKVVNIHHKVPYDVYIGRPGKGQTSKWGNPFVIGKDGTRDEVIEKFKQYLIDQYHAGVFTLQDFLDLDGKTLGCFCKPHPCHGDVLIEAIEWFKANKG